MFAGNFYRQSHPTLPSLDAELVAALNPFEQTDATGTWQNDRFLLAHTLNRCTPESFKEVTPYGCPHSGLIIASWVRLERRAELAQQLNLDTPLSELTDPMLIIAAWLRWESDCVVHLHGAFAFAIIDPKRHLLFLARDPVGIRPLYYQVNAAECRFSTTAAVFSRVHAWKAEPDLDWVMRYLLPNASSNLSRTETAFHGIVKLEPGHWLLVASESIDLKRYHHFRDDAPFKLHREERWVDCYRSVLETVIREQMRSPHKLGVENSGGIDSATLTSFIARELGEPGERLTSFGFALCEQEPAYILETSQAHRIVHNHIFTQQPGRSDEVYERGLTVFGYPEEHNNGSGHIPFYDICQKSLIKTLFSGFGGDEVITNPGYHLRSELLDRGHYLALWGILPGTPITKTLRLLKEMAGKRYQRPPQPLPQAIRALWPFHVIQQNLVDEFALLDEYMRGNCFHAAYRRINEFALSGRLNAGFVPARLENCSLMAQSYGVDYRWPLLDTRLIQQYLSTPSIEKYGPNGMGRYLHRRAIEGVVPHRVAWKPTKDMGYAKLILQNNQSAIIAEAKEARRQEAQLHPVLETVIDRRKFREQIAIALQGNVPNEFAFTFRHSANSIRWLNHWLHGHPVD